jgi:hypothetical protein
VKGKTKMKRILTGLFCAGAMTINAAEISPLETARYSWSMSADCANEFTVNGAVKLGVPVDGGGTAARFDGGRLVRKDATSLLKGLDAFTLYLRVKPDGKCINGTVMCQRGANTQNSGAFEFSAWEMPFIERQHLTFQGMIAGVPAAGKAFPELVKFHNVPKEYDCRHDPFAVFKRGDTWFMTATTVRPKAKEIGLPLYKSKDLINWDFVGEFFRDETGRPINECGQLFPLGGKMVFTTIHDRSGRTALPIPGGSRMETCRLAWHFAPAGDPECGCAGSCRCSGADLVG